jgi:NADP-dependent 3-hydroxy acid dehydrogenase YdfG
VTGIGRELVKVLHSKDATVYVVSRFKKHLTSLKIECPNIIPIEANLRNWKDTEEALAEKIDGIDMLVNNAEELHRQNFFEIRPETFDRYICDTNYSL